MIEQRVKHAMTDDTEGKLIIDCSYSQFMQPLEFKSLVSQVGRIVNELRHTEKPMGVHLVGCDHEFTR
jgi:hypothetical protein